MALFGRNSRPERRGTPYGALVVGFVFWFAAAPELQGSDRAADPRLLAALAAWTAIQVVMLARVARREGPPAFAPLFAIALALVGSLGVITASSTAELPNLRAIWATLVAGGAAALATWARRAMPTWVEPLGAITLGLVAVGLGLALSGATLTLAWALLLVVAAWLHGRNPTSGLAAAVVRPAAGPSAFSIAWLLVHPLARRRGVATALVARAVAAARAKNSGNTLMSRRSKIPTATTTGLAVRRC